MISINSFSTQNILDVGGQYYTYYSLMALKEEFPEVARLPISLKILLENLLRFEDGRAITADDIVTLANWPKVRTSDREIAYTPARVLMQDFTGVPAVVDLAAMRSALARAGKDPKMINPLSPVDLVIDHSVMVDAFGTPQAFEENVHLEFKRNGERYEFLKWGQTAFDNFRVVPPGTGICHQVNLEYLAQVVWTKRQGNVLFAYPDTLVGTDSHTTMVNGLAVLGWGVGGIEAEAAMLGQPISMLIPEVVGFKLTHSLQEGVTATDLVLTVTNMLRAKGVVGKFVEFCGNGLNHLTLADRATIANMAPEYGATCGFFPVDQETLNYLEFTGRDPHRITLVEQYAKAQGMWHDPYTNDPVFTDTLELDLRTVEPSLAGPKRPQDRVKLIDAPNSCAQALAAEQITSPRSVPIEASNNKLQDGDVVIAAITSCTNTSNPSVMVGAGLLARKARQLGLTAKPWVKTSLAPGSQVVTDYLQKSNLHKDLEAVGFYLVGYGCTTCIGNSGPLLAPIAQAIDKGELAVSAVLSGNRNFEGRIHPQVKLNYLASPPLVVAYALAGSMTINLSKDPIGTSKDGKPVYLKDIWPSTEEINQTIAQCLTPQMFKQRYANVFSGEKEWQSIKIPQTMAYEWQENSTYIKEPTFFSDMPSTTAPVYNILKARPLAILGDSVTTDHISPAGSIKPDSPAGKYLQEHGIKPVDFNSYGSRRGNHEVMVRGTFANIRLRNEMVGSVTGGFTKLMPEGTQMSIYDASMMYQKHTIPLIIIAGKEYGTGSSRDWAAKGTRLLGVKAVIAESFERIHRSNLIGMGILPLTFKEGMTRQTLKLTGSEVFDITGISERLTPRMDVTLTIYRQDGQQEQVPLLCRLDTVNETEYYRHGGILQYVLRHMATHS